MANFNGVGAAGIALSSNDHAATDLLAAGGATANGGRYKVQMWTPDTTVYVGGSGLSVGGDVQPSGAASGFLLLPNQLYTVEAIYVSAGGEQQLLGTSTVASDGNTPGGLLYVLIQLVIGG
jgi:hypothetical protein